MSICLARYQFDIAGFSELVSVHGKACLAGNSVLLPKGTRSPWTLTKSPIRRYCGTLQPRCSTPG
ncbi:MAG: hypothetical protein H6936_08075 [Burkholderiales bacterium]|nr:hypothetical protein [Nitrosomonas sp.]MCP5274797.1 hypothetical protein [Burkholderiales bacterium]